MFWYRHSTYRPDIRDCWRKLYAHVAVREEKNNRKTKFVSRSNNNDVVSLLPCSFHCFFSVGCNRMFVVIYRCVFYVCCLSRQKQMFDSCQQSPASRHSILYQAASIHQTIENGRDIARNGRYRCSTSCSLYPLKLYHPSLQPPSSNCTSIDAARQIVKVTCGLPSFFFALL